MIPRLLALALALGIAAATQTPGDDEIGYNVWQVKGMGQGDSCDPSLFDNARPAGFENPNGFYMKNDDDDYLVNLEDMAVKDDATLSKAAELLSTNQNTVTFTTNVKVAAGQKVTGDNVPFGTYVASSTNGLGATITLSKNIATPGLCPSSISYTTTKPCKLEFGGTPMNFRIKPWASDMTYMVIEDIWGMLEAKATGAAAVDPVTLAKSFCGGTCGLNPPSPITGIIDTSATSPVNTNTAGQKTITLTETVNLVPPPSIPGAVYVISGNNIPGTIIQSTSDKTITLHNNVLVGGATGTITINPWLSPDAGPCAGKVDAPTIEPVGFATANDATTNDKTKCYKATFPVGQCQGLNAMGVAYTTMTDGTFVFNDQSGAFENTAAQMSFHCRLQSALFGFCIFSDISKSAETLLASDAVPSFTSAKCDAAHDAVSNQKFCPYNPTTNALSSIIGTPGTGCVALGSHAVAGSATGVTTFNMEFGADTVVKVGSVVMDGADTPVGLVAGGVSAGSGDVTFAAGVAKALTVTGLDGTGGLATTIISGTTCAPPTDVTGCITIAKTMTLAETTCPVAGSDTSSDTNGAVSISAAASASSLAVAVAVAVGFVLA